MNEMKSDMAGAAAVVQATCAIARLKLPVKVSTFVPMAENMVSGSAVRPGDVLTMYGGTTVEVLNTDAEGRLVLGDALVRATEVEARRDPRRRHADRPHGRRARRQGGRRDGLRRRRGRGARRVRDRRRGALAHADPRGDGRPDPHQQDRRPVPARLDPLGRRPVRRGLPARVHRRARPGRTSTSPAPPGTPAGRPVTVTFGGTGLGVATLVDYARDAAAASRGERREPVRWPGSRGPAASCAGCSPASAAGCRRPRRRRTGSGCLLQNLCAHSTDGTRRRVHSPSWATSSRVTSLTAVRGSTNPSMPRALGHPAVQVVLVDRVRRAHPGRAGAGRVALRAAQLGPGAAPEAVHP